MSSWRAFIGFLTLSLVFLLPLLPLGWLIAGVYGLAVAFGVGACLFLLALHFSEWIVISTFPDRREATPGLKRSYRQVVQSREVPSLLVYADPIPNALVVRGLWGRGVILLSQGAVAGLTEPELHSILKLCFLRSRESGIVLRTFSSALATFTLRFASSDWQKAIFHSKFSGNKKDELDPFSAFLFLMVFVFCRIFFTLSRGPLNLRELSAAERFDREAAQFSALRKISQSVEFWHPVGSPAAFSLYLIDPWSRQTLFHLS